MSWIRLNQRRPALVGFLLAFLWFCVLHAWHGVHLFLHDAKLYWELAVDPGAVPASMHVRGYVLPMLLGIGLRAGSAFGIPPLASFQLVSSAACAAILAVAVPSLVLRLWGGIDTALRRLVPCLLVGLVFPGLVVYPMSDVAALGFAWGAVLCLLRAHDAFQASLPRTALSWAAFAGICAAGAYNTRTVYLFALLLLLPAAAFLLRRRLAALALTLATALLVCLPQVHINLKLHDKASANPALRFNHAAATSLFASQLAWGIRTQKYETLLRQRSASVVYVDPVGVKLWDERLAQRRIRTVTDYVKAVARYPVFLSGMLGRHLVNALDVQDGLVYVEDARTDRRLRGLASFVILLGAVLLAFFSFRHARFAPVGTRATPRPVRLALLGVLLVPAIAALPGVVETRFMLPLHVLAFGLAAMRTSAASLQAQQQQSWTTAALLSAAALVAFCAITSTTMSFARIM